MKVQIQIAFGLVFGPLGGWGLLSALFDRDPFFLLFVVPLVLLVGWLSYDMLRHHGEMRRADPRIRRAIKILQRGGEVKTLENGTVIFKEKRRGR